MAPPRTINLWSHDIIRYYPPFLMAIPNPRVGTHALLPLTPVPPLLGFPRLACLIHAANVRSEPGSNPSTVFCEPLLVRGGDSVRVRSAVVRYDSKVLAVQPQPPTELPRMRSLGR